MKRETMKIRKAMSIILAAFLFTGMAASDTPDIPTPGITPDSPFYALEKASEKLEIAVAQAPVIGSEELEAKVRANHAAETLAEARAMAEKNNTEQVEKLMNRYSENMNKSIESASSANETELKQRLRNVTINQNQALEELDDRVPEQAQKGIQKAMENNRRNQRKLGNPPARAPTRPGSDTAGKTEQGGENTPTGKESAPITGRSTAPENPATEPSNDEKPENSGERNSSSGGSTGQETQDRERNGSSPDGDTDGGHSKTPDEPGSGSRP